jgi:hypothetical protein
MSGRSALNSSKLRSDAAVRRLFARQAGERRARGDIGRARDMRGAHRVPIGQAAQRGVDRIDERRSSSSPVSSLIS